jgi:serine/threonine-protein kinase
MATGMIALGQTVGNYRVVAKLGEGAMGAVFLAEHPVIGRKAALKVINPEHARNPEVVARFVNEATAINRVGHEHIVEVTDFGRTPAGDFYFAMEYLEGHALSDLIARDAPFAPARALAIAAQIADALAASHAHGVIHRDLKPENVFLVTRGEDASFVKVLDFGLAKLVHEDGARRHETRPGVVMGTPYYMAPEQCEGRVELDARADIYSLGVVLFEMLTGHLPFGGAAYGEVLMKHLTMRPPSARSLVPGLPEELDVILDFALAKRPDERFTTMEQFREALLAPATYAPPAPRPRRQEELSRLTAAAQPMSRAEIARRRTIPIAPPTTLGAGSFDRVPRYTGPRTVALVAVTAMAGMALAAGVTYGEAVRRTTPARAAWTAAKPAAPRSIAVTFSSDPSGALVRDAEGRALGTTPLSIEVPRSDRPARCRFEMAGFEPKAMESIPNVPSAMFAHLQPEDRRGAGAATAETPRHRSRAARLRESIEADGVLAPAFLKSKETP